MKKSFVFGATNFVLTAVAALTMNSFTLNAECHRPSVRNEVINEDTHVRYTDLQTAIDEASSSSTNTLLISGNFIGNYSINKNIVLRGLRTAALNGNQTGSVLTISAPDFVEIDNLTIENGYATFSSGGIRFAPPSGSSPTLKLKRLDVKYNVGTFGGGLDVNGIDSTTHLIVENSNFHGNLATIGDGGAISARFTNKTEIINSKFKHNTASNNGGAIIITDANTVKVSDIELYDNEAINSQGGGLYISDATNVKLKDIKAERNFALIQGGALQLTAIDQATLKNLLLQGNLTTGGGAAISNTGVTSVIIKDSVISNNHAAGSGAAINNIASGLLLKNSTLKENTVVFFGGAIYNSSIFQVTIEDSTIEYNVASSGGGIYNDAGSILNIVDSKIKHNTPDNVFQL